MLTLKKILEDNSSPLEAIIDHSILHDVIALMLFKYVYNRLKMYLLQLITDENIGISVGNKLLI